MKRLLFAPLLISLLVASCSTNKKYNSYREAVTACNEWAAKAGTYDLKNPQIIIPARTTWEGEKKPREVRPEKLIKYHLDGVMKKQLQIKY